jgi:hypothetical protein
VERLQELRGAARSAAKAGYHPEAAKNRVTAAEIWKSQRCQRFETPERRLTEFRGLLRLEDLIDAATFRAALPRPPIDEMAMARSVEAARERQALLDEVELIVEAVGDRQQALAVLNRSAEPLSREKLGRWRRALVSEKLLPATFLTGARVGAALSKRR